MSALREFVTVGKAGFSALQCERVNKGTYQCFHHSYSQSPTRCTEDILVLLLCMHIHYCVHICIILSYYGVCVLIILVFYCIFMLPFCETNQWWRWQLSKTENSDHWSKQSSPVELVEMKSAGEVIRQYKRVTNTLQSGVHEARVTEVVEPRCTSFYWHYTATSHRHTLHFSYAVKYHRLAATCQSCHYTVRIH